MNPLTLIGFLAAGLAHADPCAVRCEQYADVLSASSLSRFAAAAGLGALQGEGAAFDTRGEREAIRRLREAAREAVPAECQASIRQASPPSTRVVARMGSREIVSAVTTDGGSVALLDKYRWFAKALNQGCGGAYARGTEGYDSMTEEEQDALLAEMTEKCEEEGYSTRRLTQITGSEERLAYYIDPSQENFPTAEEWGSIRVFHSLIHGAWKNDEEAMAYLARETAGMSTEEKLQLIQMMGEAEDRWAYDSERRDQREKATGAVNGTTVLAAIAEGSARGEEIDAAGVCRDHHKLAGKMARAMGFRHSYVVTSMDKNGEMHANLITTDPDKDLRTYRIDYEDRIARKGGRSNVLLSSDDDASLGYLLHSPDGPTLRKLPSEMGKTLVEAAGFDVRSQDPLATPVADLMGADQALGQERRTQLRAVLSGDANDARYVLAAISRSFGEGGALPGRVGLVAGSQTRPGASALASEGTDEHIDFAYARIEQGARARPYREGRVSIEPGVVVAADAYLGRFREIDPGADEDDPLHPLSPQVDFDVTPELVVVDGSPLGATSARYSVRTQLTTGVADVGDPHMPQVPIVVHNHTEITGEWRARVAGTVMESIDAVAKADFVVSALSARARLEAGIAAPRWSGTAWVEGRLDEDMAVYEDASARAVGLRGSVALAPGAVVTAAGYLREGKDYGGNLGVEVQR